MVQPPGRTILLKFTKGKHVLYQVQIFFHQLFQKGCNWNTAGPKKSRETEIHSTEKNKENKISARSRT